ncbi:MAG TPA: 3-hydroxyacyl-ACP dehydratase FabZ [Firmicutes bacterium]|nr:3-hydroxyacyl-ACP dehydratase FabZ [Bacillota bacterium]
MIDAVGVQKVLPHRFPFLLIDRVLEVEPGKRAVAIKNVTVNEPFFEGHFPNKPIMPGVLIIEAMAQVCGVAAMLNGEEKSWTPYFVGIDKARFRRPVTPGDQLRIEVEITKVRGNVGRATCSAFVDGRLVADGELTFALVEDETNERNIEE